MDNHSAKTGNFPGKKQSSNLEEKLFEKFLEQLD